MRTPTKIRLLPVLAVGVLVVAGGIALLDPSSFGRAGAYECRGDVADVELEVELGRVRPVEITYQIGDSPIEVERLTTNHWIVAESAVECPALVTLMVRRGDVWGGKTRCAVRADGRKVDESNTTGQADCYVAASLLKS